VAAAANANLSFENARLLNELRDRTTELSESLEQQTATSEVLGVISSSPGELEPVFQAMLANAARLCDASYGVLWLCEGDTFRAAALHGPLPTAFSEQLRRGMSPGPTTALGRAASTHRTVHIADLRTDKGYLDRDPLRVASVELAGIRAVLAVPMLKEHELIGAISMYRRDVRPFTDKQIALVTNFASQAVIAIENARLLTELRESLEQQTATADVLPQRLLALTHRRAPRVLARRPPASRPRSAAAPCPVARACRAASWPLQAPAFRQGATP
jgi:GAF domain-containing protein